MLASGEWSALSTVLETPERIERQTLLFTKPLKSRQRSLKMRLGRSTEPASPVWRFKVPAPQTTGTGCLSPHSWWLVRPHSSGGLSVTPTKCFSVKPALRPPHWSQVWNPLPTFYDPQAPLSLAESSAPFPFPSPTRIAAASSWDHCCPRSPCLLHCLHARVSSFIFLLGIRDFVGRSW